MTTASVVNALAAAGAFRPRQRFRQLVDDHVPFDALVGQDRFEASALRAITADSTAVAIVGPRGGGKSSLIAYVCDQLPSTHVALRVPVAAADDPTDTSTIAAVALGQALDTFDLERYQQAALEKARSDTRSFDFSPPRIGGKLGGGLIPAELHGDLATMREELSRGNLTADRLSGLERLITILVAREIQPIFVFEDTEAAIGGADLETANAFLSGPVRAFAREVDAPCLIAVQTVFRSAPAFNDLAPCMALIDLPVLNGEQAPDALRAIIDNRIAHQEIDASTDDVIRSGGLDILIAFYDETGQNLRLTLAALHSAVDHAADAGARCIETGHLRAATADWRDQIS